MKAERPLSVWLMATVLCGGMFFAMTARAEQGSDRGDQLWKDYHAMKEQYRQAYRSFDPMRPNYAPDDPRAAQFNQPDARALAQANAARARLRATIEAQQAGIAKQIQGR